MKFLPILDIILTSFTFSIPQATEANYEKEGKEDRESERVRSVYLEWPVGMCTQHRGLSQALDWLRSRGPVQTGLTAPEGRGHLLTKIAQVIKEKGAQDSLFNVKQNTFLPSSFLQISTLPGKDCVTINLSGIVISLLSEK